MASRTQPLTATLIGDARQDPGPLALPADLGGDAAARPTGAPTRSVRRISRIPTRAWETGAGGVLAGLAGALLAGVLPLPDPDLVGPGGLARGLLWLGGAGGFVGGAIGGLLAASRLERPAVVAARSLLAAAWGLWVGALGAIACALAALRLWNALGVAGPVAALPPGPLAMSPVAWVLAGAAWAGLLGLLLPLAPGRPGGRPAISGMFGAIAGLVGGTCAALTGVVAPAALIVGASIALAGRRS